ncbi:MAG TPA: carbonic anhydrase [Pseudolabrys sp.]|jgi:carbonic anhydrase|nr:carbonic anhydrase [Pseudolabrys sp.]
MTSTTAEFPERLIEGYSAFLRERLPLEQSRYRDLAEDGQSPEVMVIACCDSRCSPEVIFDARPGELFVARNISGLVPPYTPDGATRAVSASLEFAVQALKVKHIVVLGHAQCGGIRAFVEENAPLSSGDFIGHWMALIAPAVKAAGPRGTLSLGGYLTKLEQASVVATLGNLMTFPCVKILAERGKLKLHGAYFGVATGELSVLDRASGKFMRVASEQYAKAFPAPKF